MNDKKDDSLPTGNSLLSYNLSLTPEQRIIEHQKALDLVIELQKAGNTLNEKPERSATKTS